MILPDFICPSRVNQHWKYSGLDSPDQCLDKKHFNSYPYTIDYLYNSRGYRDQEWPTQLNQLKDAIWCIGDSFTVGLGSPVEHTWPYILQQHTGQRTINVSMDGASNNWIARCVNLIQKEIDPKNIIVMWSYVNRRELENTNLSSEQRRLHFDKFNLSEDLLNFKSCQSMINPSNTIQLTIPRYAPEIYNYQPTWENIRGKDWSKMAPRTLDEMLTLPELIQTELKENFQIWTNLQEWIEQESMLLNLEKNLIKVDRLDLARDGHHFDLITSQWVVDQIVPHLN